MSESLEFFTIDDLAQALGESPRQVMIWRREFGWPSFKIGRQIRFTREHVQQIVARHSASPETPDLPDIDLSSVAPIEMTTRGRARWSA